MSKITSREYDEDFVDSLSLEDLKIHILLTRMEAFGSVVETTKTEEHLFRFREGFHSDEKAVLPLFLGPVSTHWFCQEVDVSESSQIKERKLELLEAVNALQSCFDDPTERHIQYFRFKEELKRMRDIISSRYWDLLRLIVGCIDATTNTQAANLSLPQVRAFKKVIEQMRIDTDCSAANSLLNILISAGLKPVPDLRKLEPIEI